tara:strand:+ start:1544 stop:2092 length:549 start_codon:yes stop_codon:yes gene_type:complete
MAGALPSLGGLNPLQLENASIGLYPPPESTWRIEFRQKIENDSVRGLLQVVDITVTGGPVQEQREMLDALGPNIMPMFEGFTPSVLNDKLIVVCSDKSKSYLQWQYEIPYVGIMPPYGVPPASVLPGGSPYVFLQRAFGAPPVGLNGKLYTWEQAPGLVPSISLDVWLLKHVLGFGGYPSRR